MTDGLNGVPAQVQELINSLRTRQKNAFRLRWKGTNIPRGASIDGKPILWTQHGLVYGGERDNTETLGYYTRTKECAGEAHDEHEMLIATDGILSAGVNQTAEQIRDFELYQEGL